LAYHNLRDGDAVVTSHGLVFYVVGYEHPGDRYHAILKYVPEGLAERLNLDWVNIRWNMRGTTLYRPRELYSPETYLRLVEAFRRSFPEYLLHSKQLGRWVVAGSDIDLSVYGASHFREVKKALVKLESEGELDLHRVDRVDAKRLNRGVFRGERFMVNATRQFSEIERRRRAYRPIGPVEVECRCVSDERAVFRPAVYKVAGCEAIGDSEPIMHEVSEVVSMIGRHRYTVEAGETIRARGILEEVVEGACAWHRVFVGSALPGEYLDWLGP
jgi:predicted nucleotidyltransferase